MIAPTASGAATGSERVLRGPLIVCLFAVAVQVLDMTMLAAALPAIGRALHLPAAQQVLVVTGYSLVFGCALMAAAHFGDRFGRRRIYLTGMTGYALCAGWCAAAGGGAELVTARCLQGLCGALVAAQTLAVITTSFGPRHRTTAFAAHSATAAAVAVAGPVLGGVLVDADLGNTGWRSVFLAEMVCALVAVAVAVRFLPRHRPAPDRRSDPVGAGLGIAVVAVLLSLVLPLGGPRSVPELAFGGVCVAVALPVLVHRGRGTGRAQVFPVALFARREFALGAVAVVGFSAIFAGLPLTVSNTAQLGVGFSAQQAGMLLLPSALGAVAGALSAPMLIHRIGTVALLAGTVLFGLATVSVAVLIDPGSGRIDVPGLIVPLAVAGIGLGWFAAPLPGLLMSGIDPDDTGAASGSVPTLQQLGGALGPVILLARPEESAAASDHLAALVDSLLIVAGMAAALAMVILALPRARR
ncbi:MFS transporter [Nocardia carnea]|uniref:MFS transporter n=1 Tax=Nocardia carnea TaxID=37328 RepID=A0ABW7TQW9_9NOCA|nr:MFS transporter [Nocardia carnea]